MAPKQEKPIFKGLVVAMASSLGAGWTEADVERWVQCWGGRFSLDLDQSVTHILCAEEDYVKKTPRVKQALKLAKPNSCHIVKRDWLDDSIQKRRKCNARNYKDFPKIKKPVSPISEPTAQDLQLHSSWPYRVANDFRPRAYMDCTGFEYRITLTNDFSNGIKLVDQQERWEMMVCPHHCCAARVSRVLTSPGGDVKLLESKSRQPTLYLFRAKYYNRKGDRPHHYPEPGTEWTERVFGEEFFKFTKFFRDKTGVPWEQRLISCLYGKKFHYSPPTRGKPVGCVPAELDCGLDSAPKFESPEFSQTPTCDPSEASSPYDAN